MLSAAALGWLRYDATNFPTEGEPVRVVDAALVERLRREPGRHLPLAPDYELKVELELADDPLNRWFYGTRIDLREQRDRQAIHIQVKGDRAAIHADDHNPKGGVLAFLVHATLDVPATPWIAGAVVGLWLVLTGGGLGTPEEPTPPPAD